MIIISNTMKCLLVFLLILGVYCDCRRDQYEIDGLCVDCRHSPCRECQGDDICRGCKEGLDPEEDCISCVDDSKMPINWKCVECSTLGATQGVAGVSCRCTPGDTRCCPQDKGGFWASDWECRPCSDKITGCESCIPRTSGGLTCLKCGNGFKEITEDGKVECVPGKAAHLLTLGGLLISLLILL